MMSVERSNTHVLLHCACRYLRKRHASTLAALQPAFQRWRSWTMAAVHSRQHQQRVVLFAWQELVQLQLQLCARIMQGLRRGVLSGDVPGLMVWRLCTSSQQPLSAVRPSLGGMLASILLQRVPRMRQQVRALWNAMHVGVVYQRSSMV